MLPVTVPQSFAVPLEIDLSTSDPALDLTQVASVSLTVYCQDTGTTVTWSPSIVSQTPQALTALYNIQTTDLTALGSYLVGITMTLDSSETVPATSFTICVVPLWNFRSNS